MTLLPPNRDHDYKPEFEQNPSFEDEQIEDDTEDTSGRFTRVLQIGCGTIFIVAIVLAIVLPVAGTFGDSGGGNSAGRKTCKLFRDLAEESQNGVPIDAVFIERLQRIKEEAINAEPSIRDSSAALLVFAASAPIDLDGMYLESSNLIQACGNAGYLPP